MTTKEKILVSARKEFAEKGLEGSRVDRIATAAGVNKAMIYYHFASKERLYQTILEELFGRARTFIDRVLAEDLSLDERLSELARFYSDVFASSPELRPIVLREMASGGERMRAMFSRTILEVEAPRRMRALLEEGVREGTLRRVDSAHAVISFIGMNLFYLLFSPMVASVWQIQDGETFGRSRPQEVVDVFLHGIKTR
jgi:TetR/AcrR family transcriptional regulator